MRRSRSTAGFLVALSVLGATASHAVAQQPYEIADGFRDSTHVAWADAQRRCVTTLRTGFAIPAADSTCDVVSVGALGTIGGLEWQVARYRRDVVIADSAFTDTLALDELALLGHAAGAADGHLVWHVVRDRAFEFLDTLEWVHTDGDVFLVLGLCLNGTGGCHEEYLRFVGGGWHALEQPFAKELQSRLPADHWLHKGRQLDLATLTGVWPVSAPGDANCCPSLEIVFSLRLIGDALTLLAAGPPRPASR